ncbi:PTS sugar transporter subunit IIC, partial [Enterococcus faecalis]
PILDMRSRYTMALLALYATFGIASSLAKSYKLDSLTCAILALMAFLVTAAPPTRVFEDVDKVITAGRNINLANLGSAFLFGGILIAL